MASASISNASSINSSYRGSKRAACDRCLEHKSKCLREGRHGLSDNVKCARCAKAGAVCVYSTSSRAGRDPSSKTKTPAKRKESKTSSEGTPWGTMAEMRGEEVTEFPMGLPSQDEFLAPSLRADGFPTRICTSLGDDLPQATGSKSILTKDAPDGSKLLGPFAANGLTGMFDAEHLDSGNAQYLKDFELFVNNYDWSLNQTQGVNTHIPTHSPTSVASQGQNNRRGTPALFPAFDAGMREASRLEMDMGGENGSNMQLGSIEMVASSLARARSGKELAAMNVIQTSNPRPRAQETMQEAPPNKSTSHDVQHRRMRELSELGMTLYSQGMDSIPGDDSNPLNLNLPNCLAVKVLEGSVKFLNLLTSLYSFEIPSPSNIPPASSSDEEMSTSDNSESNILSVADSNQADYTRPLPPGENNSSNDDSNKPSVYGDSIPPPVDMTEIFSLLICYIRILHLHSFFYTRLSDFLLTSFRKGTRLPPVFPGLQAGGVSLDNFSKFQVKLLVQISTNVLGEIETALGLPDGYRISKKNRKHRGILDDSISVQFIAMAMKEKGTQGPRLMEEDRFASVKNRLTSLKQILKGTINT